jgi:hypothetical protein
MFHYECHPLSILQLLGLALDPRTEHKDDLLQSPVYKVQQFKEKYITKIIFIFEI